MGGFISSFISPGQKKAKRERREREAANLERQKKLDKQKAEEALVAQGRQKRRVKRSGGGRKIFTGSPLGLSDNGTDTLA